MKIIKSLGLLFFIMGFFVFNISFLASDYILTSSTVKRAIGDEEKADAFIKHYKPTDPVIRSKFELIELLDHAFEQVNSEKLSMYGISGNQIQSILNATGGNTFSLTALSTLGDDEVGNYQKRTFRDYGSWLDGREFGSKEEMRHAVAQVVKNIKEYQLINEKGFDKYQAKDLRYTLTKSASIGGAASSPWLYIILTYGLCIVGAFLYIVPKVHDGSPGIKNDNIFYNAMKNTGWLGIVTGAYLIVFYIFLYFYPEYMTEWIAMVDPVSQFLKGADAGRFFLYGLIYTICILVMGVRMVIKYRHSNYQILRTLSVMFFQTAFAFLIPEILLRLNKPYFDFKNIWPLDYDFFFDNELDQLLSGGSLGIFMLGWGIALIIVAVPVFVYFFGKRWYCSWVCGCGGLAETLGDPYRQLSDKSLKAWKIERWMIHAVLCFAVVMTGGVLYTYWTGSSQVLGFNTYDVRSVYGAWIGAGFAGVVGTGFYPLMGNRVWCRFGCPLAAYLGLVQRFKSRFRITTNGGQCISCGNCSTYCEMGIDVRWYAQRGQNIVRSSCVGCGVCSSVCPRGVLNLENADPKGRVNA